MYVYFPLNKLYIYIHHIHNTNKYIWCLMKDTLLFGEKLLPSLDLIKHVHDMINLLYYKHWTDKWKCIPFISVTHKVLKSWRSTMATLEHDECDLHGAYSLYIKTCWQSLYRVFPTGRMGESPYQPNQFNPIKE